MNHIRCIRVFFSLCSLRHSKTSMFRFGRSFCFLAMFGLLCEQMPLLVSGGNAENKTRAAKPPPTVESSAFVDYDSAFNDFGYGADFDDGFNEKGSYYADEFDNYYDTYGTYADDYGEDYFDPDSAKKDCVEDENGKAQLQDEVCDVKLIGVDEHLSKDVPGGMDGTYKLNGCFEGLPKYLRTGKSKNDTRVLWKSSVFNDWDVTVGGEVNMAKAILYGSGSGLESRPNFLKPGDWKLMAQVANKKSEIKGKDYISVNVTVSCDGTTKELEPPKTIKQPLLTDDESDANYRAIYAQYGMADPDPTINFAMVIFMIILGASVVLGLPYLMNKKKENGMSMVQMFEAARKIKQGHVS